MGDLVFDTTANKLKVFDGNSYQLAGSSVNGTSQRFKFTATASQTTFSGNDDDGNSLTYDPLFLDVYLNGVRLVNGASNDFVATNGTSIVLNAGASASDILNVVARAGNTDFDEFIYAGNEMSLTNAFESIVSNIKLCQ